MHSNRFTGLLVGFMILLDIYFFQAIRTITVSASDSGRIIAYTIYWVISISAVAGLLLLPYLHFEKQAKFIRTTLFSVFAGLFFAKLVGSLFFVADDLRRSLHWLGTELFSSGGQANGTFSRSVVFSWMGLIAGGGLFGSLVYGFNNKYRYDVKRLRLDYKNLPEAFKGLRIAHISEIHTGTFTNRVAVIR